MNYLVDKRNIRKTLFLGSLSIFLLCFSAAYSQDKELLLAQGQDASNNKNYSTAIYFFNKAIQIDSKYWLAYQERAHAYTQSGDYQKAMSDFNLVLKNEPENPSCYFGMAAIYEVFYEDNYKAINLYTKSIELSLKINDKELAGSGYLLRGVLKKNIGDKSGYRNDLKLGAALDNYGCKSLIEIEELGDQLLK